MSLSERLQALVASEFAAVHQYTGMGERCAFWGYGKLAEVFKAEALEELDHARDLCKRMEELGTTPSVNAVGPPAASVASTVPGMLERNEAAERGAIKDYSVAAAEAVAAGDSVSRALFEEHALDEQKHLTFLLGQMEQISQMGLQNYLSGLV